MANLDDRIEEDTLQKMKNLNIDPNTNEEAYSKIRRDIQRNYTNHQSINIKDRYVQWKWNILGFLFILGIIALIIYIFNYADYSGVPSYDGYLDQEDYYQHIIK